MKNVLMPHPVSLSTICQAIDYSYFDTKGKEYIDLESGIWCASLGHSHPKIIRTIEDQIKNLIHCNTNLKPEYEDIIANKILEKADIRGKVFFMNTGSEAIDFAITLARIKNKKSEIVGFSDNYLAAYGQATQINLKIDIKTCLNCVEKVCSANCENIRNKITPNCIFIFDPFCFMRQVIEIPSKLIKIIKEELKKKKALLLLDEITAGLGRTGKWFGFQHYKLQPDIIIIGKTLGNGYPVSAVIMTNRIVNMLNKNNFSYAQSHQNDPLGCKIAESVIDTLEQENLIEISKHIGNFTLMKLQEELTQFEEVKAIRGKGLMLAIELDEKIEVRNIYQRLINKGVIIGISLKYNILNIFPPYTITESIITDVINKIKQTIIEEIEYLKAITKTKQRFLSYRY